MMSSEDKVKAIEGLDSVGIWNREPSALSTLRDVFQSVFGESIDSNCEGCVRKAYGKLQLITLDKINNMEKSKFKLKEGVLLPFGEFGSGEFLSKANLTDTLAYQALEQNPSLLSFFSEYPKDEEGNLLEQESDESDDEDKDRVIKTDVNGNTLTEDPPADVDPNSIVVTDNNGVKVDEVSDAVTSTETNTVLTNIDGTISEDPKTKVPDLSNITKGELLLQYAEKFGHQHPDPKVKKSDLWILINA